MWAAVEERKHIVTKVFPGRFQDPQDGDNECELMLFGEVGYKAKDGTSSSTSWAGHAVVTKELDGEREEWKIAQYRVWK